MRLISVSLIVIYSVLHFACQSSEAQRNPANDAPPAASPAPPPVADRFAYPLGPAENLTQAKDKKDEWYNAQDFGENNHLGEDWNKNSGGDTDCGAPVYAIAAGRIVFAENAGPGWGSVVIVEHVLADGTKIESLYGHLRKISKTSGDVALREQLGEVGNADGKYFCHLHFELRTEDCPMWRQAGPGYSTDRRGWLDPSDFIDRQRRGR
ncbi:MAG: M23 family metallopeptidase [Acidobacteria bacterium]|nr:M23 family metallopeptidase [Acidobacteriota bacterium]